MAKSLADAAREYGGDGVSGELMALLAKGGRGMQDLIDYLELPVPTAMGKGATPGKSYTVARPVQAVFGHPGQAIERLASGGGTGEGMSMIVPTGMGKNASSREMQFNPDMIDLATILFPGAGKLIKEAPAFGRAAMREFENYAPKGAISSQAGKVSVSGDVRPKVLREPPKNLVDEFPSPEAAAEAAVTPPSRAPSIITPGKSTVMRPKQTAFPGIYDDPRALVAATKIAPEDPMLKRLFGVTRDDLWEIGQHGQREGNLLDLPFRTAKNPKGSKVVEDITNPRNTQRNINLIEAARERPELFKPMASWYVMDPAYQRMEQLYGKELAPEMYRRFNAMVGMASPGSEVLSEINRGTAAHWLASEGRFEDFKKFGGVAADKRGADFPEDMRAIIPHPYHPTAQAGPMERFLRAGELDMDSAKVPTYIAASGVPETGFQTRFPVGDAHFSRIIGLPDVRPAQTRKGVTGPNTASASVPEMIDVSPWFRERVAREAGLEAVPGQGVLWGAGSSATGVTSPIGAGKLELTAGQIAKAARRAGISPEEMRDRVLMAKAMAGKVDPELLAVLAAGSAAGAGAYSFMQDDKE